MCDTSASNLGCDLEPFAACGALRQHTRNANRPEELLAVEYGGDGERRAGLRGVWRGWR